MHDIFSFSHQTKTKVTVLTHNKTCTIITVHWHSCIKFLSSLILCHHLPNPFHFSLRWQPDTDWSAHGCSSVDTGASDNFPQATVFTKHTPHQPFFPPFPHSCTAEAEVLQQHVVTGYLVSCDSTKMYRQSISGDALALKERLFKTAQYMR